MPSLAHTVPCLARTVPKPFPLLYIQYLSLLEFCLAFPVYSRLNSSHGVPADEASCFDGWMVVNGGWWWMVVDSEFQKGSLILLKILSDEVHNI